MNRLEELLAEIRAATDEQALKLIEEYTEEVMDSTMALYGEYEPTKG